jgi:hypothetical protein
LLQDLKRRPRSTQGCRADDDDDDDDSLPSTGIFELCRSHSSRQTVFELSYDTKSLQIPALLDDTVNVLQKFSKHCRFDLGYVMRNKISFTNAFILPPKIKRKPIGRSRIPEL